MPSKRVQLNLQRFPVFSLRPFDRSQLSSSLRHGYRTCLRVVWERRVEEPELVSSAPCGFTCGHAIRGQIT